MVPKQFLGVIQEAQQKFIPNKKKYTKGRTRQPSLTREVKDNRKEKEKTYNVVVITGKPWKTILAYQNFKTGAKVTVVAFTKDKVLRKLKEFFEEIMSRIDKGEPIDMIYLDFQKAFDKVLYRRLLNK
eukprot:g29479.t1